jgi:hypothetical protein
MEDGRIVQRGRHAELLRQGGLYRQIHDLQLSHHGAYIEEEPMEQKAIEEVREEIPELEQTLENQPSDLQSE